MLGLKSQNGFSLFEVLIAWGLLSVVLLGLVMLRAESLHQTKTLFHRNLALFQLQSLLEEIRFSRIKSRDLFQWNQQNAHWLPGGHGDYHCDRSICTVKINWQGVRSHQLTLSASV